ncbi:MAG TPA: AMIN domain-containing protein, partial [Blastocatellia bacterium]|nr:AMIN domain-containing protein [Blastocatellia bacterium]
MIARRLVVSIVVLALVSNVSAVAGKSARAKTTTPAQAYTLVSLKHETVGALTRISIESSAPPLYTVYRPSDRLIVVDLPGGEASGLAPQYAVGSDLVDSIEVRQSKLGTRFGDGKGVGGTTRIEVSVKASAHDRSTVSGNILILELSPNEQASLTQAKLLKNSNAKDGVARDVHLVAEKKPEGAGVTVYPAPVTSRATNPQPTTTEKVVAKPETLKPARLIRDVRSEAADGIVRIFVEADGAAQFKDFVLANPCRVVVDITGVRSAFGNKTIVVGSSAVARMRVGQPSPNIVRVVLDTKSKVPYRVDRSGETLIITIGSGSTSKNESLKPAADVKAQATASVAKDAAAIKPEVKVAGERIENKAETNPADSPKEVSTTSNLIAQANRPGGGGQTPPRVTPQPNMNLPLPAQPKAPSGVKETVLQTGPAPVNRSAMDVLRPGVAGAANQTSSKARPEMAFCDPTYVGGLVSFDLRAGVDLRDMLRFISQQYGVNFILDKSVSSVPVDIRMTDVPWNQVMESVLRANRLGAVCESNGRMIRIATLAAVKEEEEQRRQLAEEQAKQIPLVTKIIHLKYARAMGRLGGTGSGPSGGGGAGGAGSGTGTGQGSLLSIVNTRLSSRGRIEMDARTNSLVVTDLPEYTAVIEDMIQRLDRPEPQVEIEARIVLANRNFLRDIGSELAGGAKSSDPNKQAGFLSTSPDGVPPWNSGTGISGGTTGASGGAGSTIGKVIGGLVGNSLRASNPNSVLALTTGVIGTGILSLAITASETKGQIRTIASPRVTATDNKTAEIVNGVQIPVQTVSNNTVTTTFVTAALRLEITPQIIEETGEVLMHVVAENNNVNFSLAGQFNNGTPGIDTQSAESIVRVSDGGTTVMGGINIDSEGHTINRTAGISRIPIIGELFKRRQTRRDTSEILFFITPRIVRTEGSYAPQRSSVEGAPNPNGPQRAATVPTASPMTPDKAAQKTAA